LWAQLITKEHLSSDFIEVEGVTFEGILINRHLIDIIGLPVKDFFYMVMIAITLLEQKGQDLRLELQPKHVVIDCLKRIH